MRSGVSYASASAEAAFTGPDGTWDADYPVTNLADLNTPSKVARVTGAGTATIVANLAQPLAIGIVALVNLTADVGQVRVQVNSGVASLSDLAALDFVLDKSGSMAGARLATLKTAMSGVLAELKTRIIGGAVFDISVCTFGSASSITRRAASPTDVDDIDAFVQAIAASGGTDFDAGMTQAKTFFDATDGGITDRRLFFVTDGEPSPVGSAADAAATLSTMSPVPLSFGINIALTNTTYTAMVDNTPGDGVPVVGASDPDALLDALLGGLTLEYDSGWVDIWPDGFVPGYRATRPFILPTPVSGGVVQIDFDGIPASVDIGAVEIARFWEWPWITEGMDAGVRQAGQEIALVGGGSVGADGRKLRTRSGEVSYLELDISTTTGIDFQKLQGLTKPFVYVEDSDDPETWPRDCFLATNEDVPAIAAVLFERDNFQFRFVEHFW